MIPKDFEFTPEQEEVLEHRAVWIFFAILGAVGVVSGLVGFLVGRFMP